MKYLKHINEWNSIDPKLDKYANEETDYLVQTIKDICLELEDEGFDIGVSKMIPQNDTISVRIQWRKYGSGKGNFFEKEVLDSCIERVRVLMEESGWFESDTENGDRFGIDEYLKFTKEKEKEYVTFGDGTAHTNF
jgi:hypothetical protein